MPAVCHPPHHSALHSFSFGYTQAQKYMLEVILGLQLPATTLVVHLPLLQDEIIPFNCQRLKNVA